MSFCVGVVLVHNSRIVSWETRSKPVLLHGTIKTCPLSNVSPGTVLALLAMQCHSLAWLSMWSVQPGDAIS